MTDAALRKWFGFFAEVGETYRQKLMVPGWSRFKTDDPVDALMLFVECYAPERGYANPNHYHLASEVLRSFKEGRRELEPGQVWRECQRRWAGYIAAAREHDLYPKGETDEKDNRSEANTPGRAGKSSRSIRCTTTASDVPLTPRVAASFVS
jgi:hypothetical protein